MGRNDTEGVSGGFGPPVKKLVLILLGIAAFVVTGIALENYVGIPFDLTYRVACAAACLLFVYKLQSDVPDALWLRITFWLALLVNVGIFFTPVTNRPISRGELLFFAAPDTVIALTVWIATFQPVDQDQRAARVRMIVILLIAIVICIALFGLGIAQSLRLI